MIAKRYGISEEALKAMIKDGVLPCSVVKCDEIFTFYISEIESGTPKSEAVKLTSEKSNVSERYVYRIINKFT